MPRASFLSTLFLCFGVLNTHADIANYGVLISQPELALPFILEHLPSSGGEPQVALAWTPLAEGRRAELVKIGKLDGRMFFAVRYLKVPFHKELIPRAGEILVIESQVNLYRPVFLEDGSESTAEDFTCSDVREIGGRAMFWIRMHLSGSGHYIEHTALSLDPISGNLAVWNIFSDDNPWEMLKADGWTVRTRGGNFDDVDFVRRYWAYKANIDERTLEIPYTFKDGQLHPGPYIDRGPVEGY